MKTMGAGLDLFWSRGFVRFGVQLYAELVLSRAMKIQGDALTRVTGLCEGIELIGGEPKVRLLSPSTVHDVIEHKRSIRQDKDLMEAANR